MSPLRNQDKCRNRMNGMNNCFNISLANLHNKNYVENKDKKYK